MLIHVLSNCKLITQTALFSNAKLPKTDYKLKAGLVTKYNAVFWKDLY